MILLDTCILIDILRRKPDALALGSKYREAEIAISVISVQELFAGLRPKEVADIEALIGKTVAVPVTMEIARRAGDLLRKYRPGHGLDSNDSLIAATAEITGAELVTCNLKHFPMFPDLKRPY